MGPFGVAKWVPTTDALTNGLKLLFREGFVHSRTHLGSRAIGQTERNFGSGSGFETQRYKDPHLHCSARRTSSARKALRST
jgi:hypothetical protein